MLTLYVIAFLAVLLPVLSGPLLAGRPMRLLAGSALTKRLRLAGEGLAESLGRPGAAIVVLLAWAAAVVAVFWPLGELAHRLQHAIDEPVLAWISTRRNPSFEQFNWFFTALGDRYPLKWVTVVGAIVFAVLWRRRFWIPLVAILAQFPIEQYMQAVVAKMVDRGHPPTGLGTYPSGGIVRICMVFGTLALFTALTWQVGRRGRIALGTFVLLLASYEGYSRLYVQKHWLTDVITGLVMGPVLFAGFAAAVLILAGKTAA